jgi:hypothetical protein
VLAACGLLGCAFDAVDPGPQSHAEPERPAPAPAGATAASSTARAVISVRVCSPLAAGFPCDPLESIYDDASLSSPKTSKEISAAGTPYLFYAKSGMYLVQVSGFGSHQNVSAAVPPTSSGSIPESRIDVQRSPDGSLAVSLSGGIVARETVVAARAPTTQPISSSTLGSGSAVGPPISISGEAAVPDSLNIIGKIRGFPVGPGSPQPPAPQPAAPDPVSPSSSPSNNPALEPSPGQPIQYVDYTGNDNNDGLSWGSAKATIMAAYDALPALGGTIYIMQGPGGDDTPIPATSNPAQGIWIMGYIDPNYSSPPPGWRQFKPNTSFIGVAATSHAANAHVTGQVQMSGGSSSPNDPCIWLSGVNGPLLFQNLKCVSTGIIIGESSNLKSDGSGVVAAATFDNVAAAPVYITGGSFWLYFNDCVFDGSYNAPSLLDNAHAAMLIDGTGNAGNTLIFITNLNTQGGGIKIIPGTNTQSLSVNGMTEEGDFVDQIPPAIYVTQTFSVTSFNFENVTTADGAPPGGVAVMIAGDGPAEAVLATNDSEVVGPATVMGQYLNTLANSTESPQQMNQVGFFNGYVVGQTNAARQNFSPVAVGFPNIAAQVPNQWQPYAGVSVTPGLLAPDGTYGAAKVTDNSPQSSQASIILFYAQGTPVAVGDYFIGGFWVDPLAAGFSGSPTTDLYVGGIPGFDPSSAEHGALSLGNQWSWQWFISKVTSASNPAYVTFGAVVGPGNPIEAYAPILLHIPTGAVSDMEAYNIATNLTSYPDGLPSGTVATLSGEQFAFGGTGNFFGVLAQSNTANRTYTFPDANGTVALTNVAQNWSAPQTLDSAVLTDPTIDGQQLDAPPIATFGAFLPGALSTSYTADTFTPDYGIVVTRVEVTVKTVSQGCSSSAVVSLHGSSDLDVPIPLGASDSGPVNILMDAGTPVQILLSTPAQGCSIPPQDANVVVHYRMQ